MSFDFKKTLTDTTPIYAVVGVADQAVSQVKDAVDEATRRTLALREDLAPKALQTKVTDTVAGVRSHVESLPSTATTQFETWSGEFDKAYTQFATRGEQIVSELRRRPEVEQVSERADRVVDQAQSAVGTVRKVAEDAQSAALGAVYSGRKQAAQETVKVAEAVEVKAETLESDARTSARSNAAKQGAATKPAAKKTTARKTTAKKAPAKKTTTRKTTAKKA